MLQWVERFKLALINEDIEEISILLDTPLTDIAFASQYLALLGEGEKLILSKQSLLKKDLAKLEKARRYLATKRG